MSFVVGCKQKTNKSLPVQQEGNTAATLVDNKKTHSTRTETIDSNEVVVNEHNELVDTATLLPNNLEENDDIMVSTPQKSSASQINKKQKKNKVKNKKQPKIEFEELVWEFGEITEGDIVERKFKFTNTGNAPLEIIATSATCGCTRPSFPFLEIDPGESNVIGVTYHSVGKEGEQNPEVTIESNTTPKTTVIKLHGIVKPKKENKTQMTKDSVKLIH